MEKTDRHFQSQVTDQGQFPSDLKAHYKSLPYLGMCSLLAAALVRILDIARLLQSIYTPLYAF
jgi:hypothetical protein